MVCNCPDFVYQQRSVCSVRTAWLAGDGNPSPQRFDVWFAFEFPPLVVREEVVDERCLPAPGSYNITHAASKLSLSVEGESTTDNTPLVLSDRSQKVCVSAVIRHELRPLTGYDAIVDPFEAPWHGAPYTYER